MDLAFRLRKNDVQWKPGLAHPGHGKCLSGSKIMKAKLNYRIVGLGISQLLSNRRAGGAEIIQGLVRVLCYSANLKNMFQMRLASPIAGPIGPGSATFELNTV
jgi:hypothetical protein